MNDDSTLSNLTAAVSATSGDLLYIVQSGVSKQISKSNLLNDYQPLDAELTAIAGLSSAANKLPYFTGSATAAVTDLSSFGRSLIDDADAATARSTLGLVIGTNIQAWDADLDTLSGKTVPSGGTLADTSSAQTFTNKTLTSPIISGASGTTAGQHGYDATNKALLVGDGSAIQSLFTSAWKTWTPTITGFSATPTGGIYRYCQIGKLVVAQVWMPNTGTSNSTGFTISAPVTSANAGGDFIAFGNGTDNGSFTTNILVDLPPNSSTITVTTGGGATGWTNSGNKKANFVLMYEAA